MPSRGGRPPKLAEGKERTMALLQMNPDDSYEIKGRGPCVSFFNKDGAALPPGIGTPFDLIGKTVFIGPVSRPAEVKGVEHWCIQCPPLGADGDYRCCHPFGLLLAYIANYWDGFVDSRPGLPGFMQ